MNVFLFGFISAYRKGCSISHILIRLKEITRLIETWRFALGNTLFTGAVLMDLSETFDCVPNYLVVTKLYVYGLSFDTVTFVNI